MSDGSAAAAKGAMVAADAAALCPPPAPPPARPPVVAARWIPDASMRVAAGFASARWAAVVRAAVGIGISVRPWAGSTAAAPPTRERRSGLEVKYLERLTKAGVYQKGRLTRRGGQRKRPSRMLGGWRTASVLGQIPSPIRLVNCGFRARGGPVDQPINKLEGM